MRLIPTAWEQVPFGDCRHRCMLPGSLCGLLSLAALIWVSLAEGEARVTELDSLSVEVSQRRVSWQEAPACRASVNHLR